ncbi:MULTISPECIES: elongation factor P 5-aminopentanone reductase [unclassified Ligilactobacillus]|uniref:elongation factor P 5-aminopentanone reductase n=1 Tax=unclassified Ligilactobacillus TaxID=2767920 RepID=UPI00385486FB
MKWALVCGASGDIGTAVARRLAAQGWSLYLHYHTGKERIASLITELQTQYSRQDFLPIGADLSALTAAPTIAEQLFSLDAVIFSQGTTEYGLFHDSDPQRFASMLKVQLQTPLRLVQLVEDKLAHSQAGRIVFVGSVYGGRGSAMEVMYSTIKGALSAFAQAYSQEVAATGITVNVVAPGAVDTRMNAMFDDETRAAVAAEVPAGRFATPQEIAYWITGLLQPEAQYMTGQTLYVTGGWLK